MRVWFVQEEQRFGFTGESEKTEHHEVWSLAIAQIAELDVVFETLSLNADARLGNQVIDPGGFKLLEKSSGGP